MGKRKKKNKIRKPTEKERREHAEKQKQFRKYLTPSEYLITLTLEFPKNTPPHIISRIKENLTCVLKTVRAEKQASRSWVTTSGHGLDVQTYVEIRMETKDMAGNYNSDIVCGLVADIIKHAREKCDVDFIVSIVQGRETGVWRHEYYDRCTRRIQHDEYTRYF